jgi:hypothetical protein
MREWAALTRQAMAAFVRDPKPSTGYALLHRLHAALRVLELVDSLCEATTELSTTMIRDAIRNELGRTP